MQFFDINSLKTDSYNLAWSGIDPMTDGRRTRPRSGTTTPDFDGDNLRDSKRDICARIANGLNNDFDTRLFNPNSFAGLVTGNLVSTGARAVRTYGDDTAEYARVGADVPLCDAKHVGRVFRH